MRAPKGGCCVRDKKLGNTFFFPKLHLWVPVLLLPSTSLLSSGHLEVTPGSTGDSATPSTAVGRENEQVTDLQIPRESQDHFSWERAQGPVSPAMNLSVPSPPGSSSATPAGHSIWHQTKG